MLSQHYLSQPKVIVFLKEHMHSSVQLRGEIQMGNIAAEAERPHNANTCALAKYRGFLL